MSDFTYPQGGAPPAPPQGQYCPPPQHGLHGHSHSHHNHHASSHNSHHHSRPSSYGSRGGGGGGGNFGYGRGGGMGGAPGYGSGGGGSDRMSGLGRGLQAPNYNTMTNLVPSHWSYYKPIHRRTQEEIVSWMRQHTISIYGERVPQPIFNFSELVAPDQIHAAFREAGYSAPSPIQAAAWPILLSSRDFVGVAKTGSGKTLGFMVPAILHILGQQPLGHRDGPIVLVLAPTRELACQIEDESKKVMKHMPHLKAACLYGGVPKFDQTRALRTGAHIVIATPGRLIDMITYGSTNLHRVTFLVLDEADRMLDMGFEPQIRQICGQVRDDRQTVMFSATWPVEIRSLAASFQRDFVRIHIGSEELLANSDVTQHFFVMSEYEKSNKLMDIFRQVGRRRMLIFTKTKKMADVLFQSLSRAGVPAMVIHGDKDQQHRDYTIERFKNEPEACLVATDVAARGLDIKQLEVVINYDFPTNIEDYVHRIGRTGRAGNKGDAYTFLGHQEPPKTMRELVDLLKRSNQVLPPELIHLAGGYSGRRHHHHGHNSYHNNNNNDLGNVNFLTAEELEKAGPPAHLKNAVLAAAAAVQNSMAGAGGVPPHLSFQPPSSSPGAPLFPSAGGSILGMGAQNNGPVPTYGVGSPTTMPGAAMPTNGLPAGVTDAKSLQQQLLIQQVMAQLAATGAAGPNVTPEIIKGILSSLTGMGAPAPARAAPALTPIALIPPAHFPTAPSSVQAAGNGPLLGVPALVPPVHSAPSLTFMPPLPGGVVLPTTPAAPLQNANASISTAATAGTSISSKGAEEVDAGMAADSAPTPRAPETSDDCFSIPTNLTQANPVLPPHVPGMNFNGYGTSRDDAAVGEHSRKRVRDDDRGDRDRDRDRERDRDRDRRRREDSRDRRDKSRDRDRSRGRRDRSRDRDRRRDRRSPSRDRRRL